MTENSSIIPSPVIPPAPPAPPSDIIPSSTGPKPATLPVGRATLSGKKLLPPSPSRPSTTKWVTLSILIVIVVGLIFAILAFIRSRQPTGISSTDPRLQPTPTVIPRPTIPEQVLGEPSEYSTDPQVLELESAIRSLKVQMDIETFSEPELAPPTVETGISFN